MEQNNVNLTFKDQKDTLIRLLKYALPFKGLITIVILMLTISTLTGMATPYLVMIFIDDYLTQRVFPDNEIMLLIIAFVAVTLGGVIATYFQRYFLQYLAIRVIQQIRIDAFKKIGKLGMRYFDRVPGGSVVSRLTNDTEAIIEMFIGVLATFLMAAFMMVSSFVMMIILDIRLALFASIMIPIIVLVIAVYRKFSARFFSYTRQLLSDLNAKIAESIEGMKIIQVFNQEDRLQREFRKINEEHFDYNMRTIRLDGLLLSPMMNFIYIIGVALILGYFGILSFEGAVTAGVVFAFIQYLERFFEPINQVTQSLNIFQQALVSASRVFTLMDDETLQPEQQEKIDKKITDARIEFKDVTFSYDGKRDVLKNISFVAEPGETVALVGHTGSGKSSIINLFMRFYEFERGEILIDGHSIKDYQKEQLKKNVGLVLQDAFIFYGTVESNIRLYHPTMTFEQVKAAAEFVSANGFIERLPDRYKHKVLEKGAAFSSGERQLLAFARTMAVDPKILILDEATANIDSETEEEIQSALEKMRKNRTTLAIAHRLSTIQNADQILVLNKGEIVERGTHDELIRLGGIYNNMYQLQNRV
ncbi:ABC transporter ATP-binding protein [Aliicoccus persicus]|uniref:ATP-binding cassette, subfamily B n=1 Tax=Aliicoccus persicus TaxID=930138 RepID=A0A662Z3J1_9STAP|nr:ABC transporter ATP-binding protein [Aliicoccus persicus]SEV86416.1 ATP-binding cassette, subfamily B [Aliicoccus persicus]